MPIFVFILGLFLVNNLLHLVTEKIVIVVVLFFLFVVSKNTLKLIQHDFIIKTDEIIFGLLEYFYFTVQTLWGIYQYFIKAFCIVNLKSWLQARFSKAMFNSFSLKSTAI